MSYGRKHNGYHLDDRLPYDLSPEAIRFAQEAGIDLRPSYPTAEKAAALMADLYDAPTPEELAEHRENERRKAGIRTIRELAENHPQLREAVIVGLARVGETINIIAAPKVGKSWLVYNLALSLAAGIEFLGFPVKRKKVLIIDNELHPETSASRIPQVAVALGLKLDDYGDYVHVVNLRGKLKDLIQMEGFFTSLQPGEYGAIIIDAWYRTLPADMDENSNGDVAALYNILDRHSARLGCVFVLIHHTSKGIQGGKAVTDVGSGAGSQSRAADTHIVLRQHEQEGVVVFEAVTRSWKPVEPFCIEWTYPVWKRVGDLDPTLLKRENRGGRPRKTEEQKAAEKAANQKPILTPEEFAGRFVTEKPQPLEMVLALAVNAGMTERDAKRVLLIAQNFKLVHRHKLQNDRKDYYATTEPTLLDAAVCEHTQPPSTPKRARTQSTRTRK